MSYAWEFKIEVYHADYCDHIFSKNTLRCVKCGKHQVTGRYD
jgi:hypothetical protein